MKFLLIIAAAGAVSLSGPRTTLDAEQARSLGIGLEVRTVACELLDEASPTCRVNVVALSFPGSPQSATLGAPQTARVAT